MGIGSNLTVYRDTKEGPAYREFYEKTEVDKILAEKDAKIAGFENALHWDNSEALINAVEKTKSLEEELAKARDEIKSLKEELFGKTKTQVFSVVDQRIDDLKAELKKKDAKILALDAEVFKQKHHTELFFSERNYAETQLRKQKFKRCLDKAKWCDERIARYTLQQEIQGISWQKEIRFYRRLKDKFIEISKQFEDRKLEASND